MERLPTIILIVLTFQLIQLRFLNVLFIWKISWEYQIFHIHTHLIRELFEIQKIRFCIDTKLKINQNTCPYISWCEICFPIAINIALHKSSNVRLYSLWNLPVA